MGLFEARQEASRRFVAERNERIEAEKAARAEQEAAAAEKERNADLDRRREEARQNGRTAYISKHQASGALGATALMANAAQSTFEGALADPSSSVERLFTTWSAHQATAAVHRILRDQLTRYSWQSAHPGQGYPFPAYRGAPVPAFGDLLDRAIASRVAAAVKAVPNEGGFYQKATEAGEAAAKAVVE